MKGGGLRFVICTLRVNTSLASCSSGGLEDAEKTASSLSIASTPVLVDDSGSLIVRRVNSSYSWSIKFYECVDRFL